MIGDFTGVPLRPEDRWTGARLAQAGVVVDHEWNLNLFAAQRRAEDAAAGMLGPGAVVPAGSGAFGVTFTTDASGEPDLMFGAGRIWVDGLEVIAAEPFRYTSQPGAFGLPNVKSALVYLEVYEEVIPPVEDPSIDDPALRGIDASARSRVGYRVRVTPVPPGDDWTQTWAALGVPGTSAVLRIYPSMERTADPCASGAPAALAPDGWLRVEVMTSSGVGAAGVAGGQQAGAQLAWSFDNGASAAAIGTVTTGGLVTPVPTPAVRFSIGDLVEVSPPGRRALAEDHGDLYAVRDVTSAGGRDTLTLRRDDMTMLEALAMPGTDVGGVVIRRWDGVAAVQSGETVATLRGVDVGVAFSVSEFGMLLAGDWWGCRIRSGATPPLEDRENVAPDGIRRHIAPLAFLRLDEGGVSDLRQVYYPLADPALTAPIDVSPATVTGRPGDNLQDALARMPATGGELNLAAGVYNLPKPLHAVGRSRLVVSGSGPATILLSGSRDGALLMEGCNDVAVRDLRVEGAPLVAGASTGAPRALVTFAGCTDVVVAACEFLSPGAGPGVEAQPCLLAGPSADGATVSSRVSVEDCDLTLGSAQSGIVLEVIGERASVARCAVASPGADGGRAIAVTGDRCLVRVLDNALDGVGAGILAGGTGRASNDVRVAGNSVNLSVPPGTPVAAADRHAVEVRGAQSATVVDTSATLRPATPAAGGATADSGVEVGGEIGPFLVVQNSSMSAFTYGVAVRPRHLPQRVLLFARNDADGQVYVNGDQGLGWEGWRLLSASGVPSAIPGVANQPVSSLTAQTYDDAHLLFATGMYDARSYFTSSSDGATWAAWAEVPPGGTTDAALAAVQGFDGRLLLFAKGGNDSQSWVNIASWTTPPAMTWTGWKQLPALARSLAAPIAVTRYPDVLLYLAGPTWLGAMYLRYTWDGHQWSGPDYPDRFLMGAVVAKNWQDSIYFFFTSNGQPTWMSTNDGLALSPWHAVAGLTTDGPLSVLVADRLYLFANGRDGVLNVNVADPGAGDLVWEGWQPVPGSFTTGIAVAATSVAVPMRWTVAETLASTLGVTTGGALLGVRGVDGENNVPSYHD